MGLKVITDGTVSVPVYGVAWIGSRNRPTVNTVITGVARLMRFELEVLL